MKKITVLFMIAFLATMPFIALAQSAPVGQPVGAPVEQLNTPAALLTTFAPMILIFVVFYFVLIRPQKKKDKKVKDMLSALKVGDRICTIGGIYGTIINIKDDVLTISVGKNNTELVITRWAIRSLEEVSIENDGEALN